MIIPRSHIHQILACVPALLVQFLTGIGWGWIAPTLLTLQNADSDIPITASQVSWLGSLGEVGRMLSVLLSAVLLDKIGRKSTLILGSIIYVLVWSIVIFTRNIYVLLATRILFGVGNGLSDVTSTIYVIETCSPNFRGVVMGALILSVLAGMTFEFFVTTYSSYMSAAIVNTLLAIGAFTSQYFTVETTYFLTMNGAHKRAKKNFTWLHANQSDIDKELQKIQENVEEEKHKTSSLKLLLTSSINLKGISSAICLGLLFSMAGFQTVVLYASLIFTSSKSFTANEYTIMFGVAKFLGTAVSLLFVERVNRRPLMISSLVVITSCNICTLVLLFLHEKNYVSVAIYPWLLFCALALFGFVSCLMITVAVCVFNEILPLSVRAIGGSLTTTAQSLGTFLTTILFWPITERFGMGTNFAIYIIMGLLTILFVHFVLPETRGKSLHEVYKKPEEKEQT